MNSPAFFPNSCRITCNRPGSQVYCKMSFPLHCGIFTELETREYIFHFNLNGEIIRARLKNGDWIHPHEWLKRTDGNDWVYYSTGGYTGVFEATGEYYLPNLQYPTNNLLGGRPFERKEVSCLIGHWHDLLMEAGKNLKTDNKEVEYFIQKAYQTILTNLPGKPRTFFLLQEEE